VIGIILSLALGEVRLIALDKVLMRCVCAISSKPPEAPSSKVGALISQCSLAQSLRVAMQCLAYGSQIQECQSWSDGFALPYLLLGRDKAITTLHAELLLVIRLKCLFIALLCGQKLSTVDHLIE